MSEDVELVRNGFEAFVSGDVERALAVFDPEVIVRVHDLPDAPEYRGLAGLAKWQAGWGQKPGKWGGGAEGSPQNERGAVAVERVMAARPPRAVGTARRPAAA